MPTTKRVVIRHPKLPDGENTAVVAERTLPTWEKAGWKLAPKADQQKPLEDPKP